MGDSVGRTALFGIPLQQEWLDAVTGANPPTYYLHSDAPLYYYSFTDAYIAMQFRSLTPAQQARFDPMITGFNPRDMYAADHIRRVLHTFPGVFEGIGEFTIHKEFVSDKVRPGPASLLTPALDSVLALAGEIGMVVIIHNDIDVPFPSDTAKPAYLDQMKALLTPASEHHDHLGPHRRRTHRAPGEEPRRRAREPARRSGIQESLFRYFLGRGRQIRRRVARELYASSAALIERFPDRFLFGSDAVAPATAAAWFKTYDLYAPLWAALSPETSAKVRVRNFERLFDAARRNVRAWEAAHPK